MLSEFKKIVKNSVIKFVDLDTAYPSLEKVNPIPAESLDVSESKEWTLEPFFRQHRAAANYTITTNPSFATILEDVLYSPKYNVILTDERKILNESNNNLGRLADSFAPQHIWFSKVEEIPGYSIIWHSRSNNYYHTLIDNLPRLYSTLGHPLCQAQQNIKLIHSRFISPAEQFYLDKFLPENITITTLKESGLYKIEKLIFSPFLNNPRFSGFVPQPYRERINQIPNNLIRRQQKNRLYISRKRAYNQRRVTNEEQLLEKLQNYGFQEYVLEKVPLEEQIDLFYNAEFIVSPHGAGLTNMLFSHNLKIIELFPSHQLMPNYYYMSKSLGHPYKFWTGQERGVNDNFPVDVTDVMQKVEEFLS
jgi:hypothetical protein